MQSGSKVDAFDGLIDQQVALSCGLLHVVNVVEQSFPLLPHLHLFHLHR